MFLKAKTEDQFENLEGEDQNKKVNILGEWPNCFLVHLNIFNQLNSQRQVKASVLVEAIIATDCHAQTLQTMTKKTPTKGTKPKTYSTPKPK